jgi:integrase
MKGTTFKRCSCKDPATGKRLGRACPQLRRDGGGWSRNHGHWYWQYELPPAADGRRRPKRDGTYPTQTDAEAVLDRIRDAIAVADPGDDKALSTVGDLIEAAVNAGHVIPDPDTVRRTLHLDIAPSDLPTMAVYLTGWIAGRKKIKKGTVRSYEGHIRLHLVPALGDVRLDRLRANHIEAMYDTIDERNAAITTLRASRNPQQRAKVKGLRIVGPTTQHRILATLRKALNDAIRRYHEHLTVNVATLIELPPAKSPKAMLWTADRVTTWKDTGKIPSPVMVWMPQQIGVFLDHSQDADDRLYALYHLIAFTGLRRGEACGLHWDDIDFDNATITVRWQIIQLGWATDFDTPKTDDSAATIAVDATTLDVLGAHRARQRRERLAAGPQWTHTGLVFTTVLGAALHPADVTDHFHHLAHQAGLPPVRLHDLRHGHATMALAAGVQMKVISGQLRHASTTTTDKFYAHILPDLARAAIEATAATVPRRTRTDRPRSA